MSKILKQASRTRHTTSKCFDHMFKDNKAPAIVPIVLCFALLLFACMFVPNSMACWVSIELLAALLWLCRFLLALLFLLHWLFSLYTVLSHPSLLFLQCSSSFWTFDHLFASCILEQYNMPTAKQTILLQQSLQCAPIAVDGNSINTTVLAGVQETAHPGGAFADVAAHRRADQSLNSHGVSHFFNLMPGTKKIDQTNPKQQSTKMTKRFVLVNKIDT